MKSLLAKSFLVTVMIIAFAAFAPVQTHGQTQASVETYKFDIGGGLGMSGYYGEANEGSFFAHPGFAINASFRYLVNTRWAFRGILTAASLSGTTEGMDNILPDGRNYDFSSWVYDLGGRVEFNFLNYGIGETYKRLTRISPYLTVGLGVALSNTGDGTFVAMSIPMGFGVKYKLRPRVNLGLELCMTKVFGDHVDSSELKDLYGIKSSFLKNTDWYSTLMLSISYEFGKRCVTCHRID